MTHLCCPRCRLRFTPADAACLGQCPDQVAAGKTNREVAAALFLSEKTIESHSVRIYDKLGLRSRTALAGIIARASTPAAR